MKDLVHEYILGLLTNEDVLAFEIELAGDPELQKEVEEIREVLEVLADENATSPRASLKERIFQRFVEIDAEELERPPMLNPSSTAADYSQWTEGNDKEAPEDYDNLHYIVAAMNEDGPTLIVWIKDRLPEEVHVDSIERFLVLEGSCEIRFDGKVHSLKEGDYLAVPLHKPHTVTVTSENPCKLIVQRQAA